MDRDGFVRLDDVVPSAWLEFARSNTEEHLSANGERDVTDYRPADEDGSPAHRLVTDPAVQNLLAGLTKRRCPRGIPEHGGKITSVLRILAGPVRDGVPYWFHYDASVVTMIVPIFIPDAGRGQSGELILLPNRRPFRHSVVRNVAEKLMVQNPLHRRLIRHQVSRAPDQHIVVLHPGSAYLFWGYRTLHGNMPCAPNALRVTLMLHYGDPHLNHPVLTAANSIRRTGHRLRSLRTIASSERTGRKHGRRRQGPTSRPL